MTIDVKVYDAEGTAFVLSDPDLSTLRDTLPGHAYEPVVLTLLGPLLRRPGAVFADIGALYGYLTVWAARHATESHGRRIRAGSVLRGRAAAQLTARTGPGRSAAPHRRGTLAVPGWAAAVTPGDE